MRRPPLNSLTNYFTVTVKSVLVVIALLVESVAITVTVYVPAAVPPPRDGRRVAATAATAAANSRDRYAEQEHTRERVPTTAANSRDKQEYASQRRAAAGNHLAHPTCYDGTSRRVWSAQRKRQW